MTGHKAAFAEPDFANGYLYTLPVAVSPRALSL